MQRLLATTVAIFAIGTAATIAGPAPTDAAIVHVLNRIGFGPRPGDVERVRAMGLDRYVDEQMHPERIADRAMAPRLADLRSDESRAGTRGVTECGAALAAAR